MGTTRRNTNVESVMAEYSPRGFNAAGKGSIVLAAMTSNQRGAGREVIVFEWIIGLLLGAVALSALARRLGVPYPVFLALGGAALAFLPHTPNWTLDPGLVLALFIAPVLLDAAYDTSVRDLKDNWVSVAGLAIAAVGLTTVIGRSIGRVCWCRTFPGRRRSRSERSSRRRMPRLRRRWLRQLRPAASRHGRFWKGESLLNDASALINLSPRRRSGCRGQLLDGRGGALPSSFAVIGSVVIGPLLAMAALRLLRDVDDVPTAIILQFFLHLRGVDLR